MRASLASRKAQKGLATIWIVKGGGKMHCEGETGARVLLGMGRRGRVNQVWQRLSWVRSTGPGLAWHCLLCR